MPRPLQAEVLISLRTSNYREAEYVAEQLAVRCQYCFDELMTAYAKITALLRDERDRLLAETRDRIICTPFGRSVFLRNYDGPPDQARMLWTLSSVIGFYIGSRPISVGVTSGLLRAAFVT